MARTVRVLGTLDRAIARFEAFVLAYGIILMAANTIANVIGRSVLGQSIYFSEELNQFLIVLVTFVGLGYAARRGRHIRMSAFYDQLGEAGRKALMIVICIGTAAVMFLMAWYSYEYVVKVATSGRVTPALRVPLYLTYLWVPLGFLITGIQYTLTVVRNLTERQVYISYEAVDAYDEVPDTAGTGVGASGRI
ncbi:MAG TPA: TRAP transporter small permease [Arenibaculum sp.]|nr:TRAP transporter small permease [Arenibaculum sp.]